MSWRLKKNRPYLMATTFLLSKTSIGLYYPPALLPSCPPALLPSCPPAHSPIFLPAHPNSSCPSALLSICLAAHLPTRSRPFHPFVTQLVTVCSSAYLPTCLPACLPMSFLFCLSVNPRYCQTASH
jgi:hypothetical protein